MTAVKRLSLRVATIPKQGNLASENEDQWFVRGKTLFGLSDGATESTFSLEWARHLVTSNWKTLLVRNGSRKQFECRSEVVGQWLQPLREEFASRHENAQLPWYARAKLDRGAHATFLGVRVRYNAIRKCHFWTAVSIGDTCLFHVRDGCIVGSFPYTPSDTFGNNPSLVSSRLMDPLPNIRVSSGNRCQPGDQLILVTDALADWMLSDVECEDRVYNILDVQDEDGLAALCGDLRKTSEMKNDDSTLLICQL